MIRTVEKLEGRADFEQIIVMKDQGGGVSLSAPPTRKHVVRRPPQSKGTFLVLNMLQTEHVNTPGEHIQML